jgi:SpoVK/Ycf46/Vps4 family AAA+-type ATPase
MKKTVTTLSIIILATTFTSCSSKLNDTVIETKHNKNFTIGEMAEIMPGLGTIMIEYSHRFYIAYYAAKAKNWELADYQLDEMLEAQEVGEATRPKYKKALKDFEDSYLSNLIKTVKAKNWEAFKTSYKKATKGCNACHVSSGHGYIKYKLPNTPPKFLSLD